MLGLVFKHQDFDIKSQKICKQKSGRVINIQGAKGPAGPIPLLPSHTSYSYNYKVKKKQQGHKSPLQRSVAVYYYSVGKSYLSNTGM